MNKGKKRKKQKRFEPIEPPAPSRGKGPAIAPHQKGLVDLSVLLLTIVFCWFLLDIMGVGILFLVFYVAAMSVSVYLMVRLRRIKRQDLFVGLGIAALAFWANPLSALTAVAAYLAGCAVFRARQEAPPLFPPDAKWGVAIPLALSAACGALMGAAALLASGATLAPALAWDKLALALNTGITDPVIFSFFMLALCMHMTGARTLSKGENILIYLLMIAPLVLMSFGPSGFHPGYALILALTTSLPLALLTRKQGLGYAVTAALTSQLLQGVLTGGGL